VAPTTAVNGTAGQMTATPYTVQPEGLVQNRVKDIVGDDSPLLQLARQNATQQMQARGLVNSSLNTTAGEQAVIAQALPIATSDAAAINQAMTNTASAQNTASQTNAQLETAMNTTNANAKNNALSASALAENTRNLAAIDNNNKQALAVLSQQNSQLLQTNANAANMFQETVKNIAAISVNDTMNKQAKDAAIATQMNLLNQGLMAAGHIGGTVPEEIQNLGLDQFFQSTNGMTDFTPAQKAQQIQNLTSQITDAKQHLRDLSTGIGVPLLTGPNASERRKPIWDQMVAEANANLRHLNEQLAALNTPVAP
jgi:predicted component of type VI protein secretion system